MAGKKNAKTGEKNRLLAEPERYCRSLSRCLQYFYRSAKSLLLVNGETGTFLWAADNLIKFVDLLEVLVNLQ